ncbi:MAG TPA: Ada metal-binding domain-containing protein, partial [Desulfosarcina sp.]|nr:Ada metal-binding domain-containing protein [Desulfosarcina sp.]
APEAAEPRTAGRLTIPPPPHTRGGADGREPQAAVTTEAKEGGMGRYLSRTGLRVGSLLLEKPILNLVALIGNAGVGKTTSIAKLAAHFSCIHKEKVGLLSLDRRSIGGYERLQIYADGMDLPLEAVRRPEALTGALDRMKACRLILIDTPAVDPDDSDGVAQLRSQFEALGEVTTLLTVSAESREVDLEQTAVRCAGLKPDGIVITKADLTRSYEDMVNFLCRQGLAVYYFSSGRRVPVDFTAATIEGLAERFLQNAAASAPALGYGAAGGSPLRPIGENPEATRYLANKSSDIFHRPGCKWIRLINEAHIVEFDSFAEALNHRFKPCRYCNPQHITITGMLSRESAAQ